MIRYIIDFLINYNLYRFGFNKYENLCSLVFLADICNFGCFQFFRKIRTNYWFEFNNFNKYVNLMCFSILYKELVYANPVHKKLSSYNVAVPNLCDAPLIYLFIYLFD